MKKILIVTIIIVFSLITITNTLKANTESVIVQGKIDKVNDIYYYSFIGVLEGDVATIKYLTHTIKTEAVNTIDLSFVTFTTTEIVKVTGYVETVSREGDFDFISIYELLFNWEYDESKNASSYLPIITR